MEKTDTLAALEAELQRRMAPEEMAKLSSHELAELVEAADRIVDMKHRSEMHDTTLAEIRRVGEQIAPGLSMALDRYLAKTEEKVAADQGEV